MFSFTCGCTSASAGEVDDESTTTPPPSAAERGIDDTTAPTPRGLGIDLDPSTPAPETDESVGTVANGGRGQHTAPGVLFILSGVGGLFVGLVGAIVAAL